jgi:hypothetical protein
MTKLTIDLKDIVKLAADGQTFVMNPDAEKSIVSLLEAQANIEQAIETIKQKIVEQGTAINENFTGVRGGRIQASYRPYGAEYAIEAEIVINPAFVERKTTNSLKTDAVKEYVKENGITPIGIKRVERKKTLSIKYVK